MHLTPTRQRWLLDLPAALKQPRPRPRGCLSRREIGGETCGVALAPNSAASGSLEHFTITLSISWRCHGRARPGHPRLTRGAAARKTWMPATSAGMTRGSDSTISENALDL